MINFLCGVICSKIFIVYWIVCIFIIEIQLRRVTNLQPKTKEAKEIDEKYAPFTQNQSPASSNLLYRLAFWLSSPILIVRVIVGLVALISCSVFIYVSVIILGQKNPIFRSMAYVATIITGYMFSFTCSIIWIDTQRPKICYKKYLGEDWKPTYENYGTTIGNHSSWADTCIMMSRQPPSNLAKASVRKLPGLGIIAASVGSLFIDRNSKDQKKDIMKQITERQIECEKGNEWPLIIFPEGGTTNGSSLIEFKKGAFAGLISVMPIGIRYYSPVIPITSGCLAFESHLWLVLCNPFAIGYVTEFPVFKPNQFFFDNHLKEGEEKWECYARVVRDIIATQMKIKLANGVQIEEKFEYRKLIFKNKQSFGE